VVSGLSSLDKIRILKKILKEAENIALWQQEIYTSIHNFDASWIVKGILSGVESIAQHLIPNEDNTYDIGSETYAWRRIFGYVYRFIPTSPPPSPSKGDVYFDIAWGTLRFYDGSKWVDLMASVEILAEGTHTPSALGTEETVYETTEKGKYAGYISVKNLQSGDSVTINLYLILTSGGSYELYDTVSLSGAQTRTVVPLYEIPVSYGMKITINQTAGTIRSYDYVIFRVQR